MINLTILGCHSATPRVNAFPTSQYLEINNNHFLIDCGEGTQRQMRKYKVGFSKINHIFISHLHGDHFYGLVGLLSTYGILSREKEMHIFGPKGIKKATLQMLKISESHAKFNMVFHELSSKESELIYEDDRVIVRTIPLNHRVPCNGFLISEQVKPRRIVSEAIKKYGVPLLKINAIKAGEDYINKSGQGIANKLLTTDPPPSFSYAYCSDTTYFEAVVPIIQDADVLYHEATFMDNEKEKAALRFHSTTKEAATIAKMANVGQLIIGHYSAKYKDLEPLLEEANSVFPKTVLAIEGQHYPIG